jgi:hypothetical protein
MKLFYRLITEVGFSRCYAMSAKGFPRTSEADLNDVDFSLRNELILRGLPWPEGGSTVDRGVPRMCFWCIITAPHLRGKRIHGFEIDSV